MNRLKEIDDRMEQIRSDLRDLTQDLDDLGELNDDQAARFDELENEYGKLAEEREPLAEEAERARKRRNAAIERMNYAMGKGGSRATESGGADVFVRDTRRSPFDDLDDIRAGTVPAVDLRSRALTAIERAPEYVPDEQREQATRLVERNDRHGRIARHMLLTGSPEYEQAFEAVLARRQPWELDQPEARALRAAMSLTQGNGGYLVPFHLDPTIILTNAGSTNPLRQISRVEQITGDNWHGITSAGVEAEWLAEASEAADASPTFSRPEIRPEKAAAYLQGSFEVTQDTGIAAQVGMLLADAKDNLEADAFATGSGTGQPNGVVTAVAAVSGSVVETDSVGAYEVGDVYTLKGAVPPRHRSRTSWLGSESIYLLTRQFATGSGPQHAFWTDLGMDTPSLLLGRPIYESSQMATTVAAGNNILLVGDFSKYLIVDRIGMTVQFEPLVKGANQRPTGEVGWFAHWRVGADVLDANAFRLLQVASA